MRNFKKLLTFLILFGTFINLHSQKKFSDRKINNLKNQASQLVEDDKKMTQVMIDKVFSFGELGFQEFETSKYLSSILEENGFDVEYKISNIPTSWLATWSNSNGGPIIALGSDFDGVPSTSQAKCQGWRGSREQRIRSGCPHRPTGPEDSLDLPLFRGPLYPRACLHSENRNRGWSSHPARRAEAFVTGRPRVAQAGAHQLPDQRAIARKALLSHQRGQ